MCSGTIGVAARLLPCLTALLGASSSENSKGGNELSVSLSGSFSMSNLNFLLGLVDRPAAGAFRFNPELDTDVCGLWGADFWDAFCPLLPPVLFLRFWGDFGLGFFGDFEGVFFGSACVRLACCTTLSWGVVTGGLLARWEDFRGDFEAFSCFFWSLRSYLAIFALRARILGSSSLEESESLDEVGSLKIYGDLCLWEAV